MPKIDLKELKKKEETKAEKGVVSDVVGGQPVFYHADYPNDVFDNFSECLSEATRKNQVKEASAQGLNEQGQLLTKAK